MFVESMDVVFYTCIFLLPGFVVNSVMEYLVVPHKHIETKYIFSCLLYSIVSCAILSGLYKLVFTSLQENTFLYWGCLVFISVIGSALIAVIIGVARQKNFIKKILEKIGINVTHRTPTAWDYFFSKQESCWVIVTLKSGKIIYGKYGENSFSSSDPDERDLYIEKTYEVDNQMNWSGDESNKGILVSKEEIETIEFLE